MKLRLRTISEAIGEPNSNGLSVDVKPAQFNVALKKALKEKGVKIESVRTVNAYKWPNCNIQVYGSIPNELRLALLKAMDTDLKGVRNLDDINYGNITGNRCSALASVWVKALSSSANESVDQSAMDAAIDIMDSLPENPSLTYDEVSKLIREYDEAKSKKKQWVSAVISNMEYRGAKINEVKTGKPAVDLKTVAKDVDSWWENSEPEDHDAAKEAVLMMAKEHLKSGGMKSRDIEDLAEMMGWHNDESDSTAEFLKFAVKKDGALNTKYVDGAKKDFEKETRGVDESKEEGEIFVVYGHAGKYNGTAYVRARDKKHARHLATTNSWLDTGTVDKVETLEEYKKSGMFDDSIDEVPELAMGEWEEIEWGS